MMSIRPGSVTALRQMTEVRDRRLETTIRFLPRDSRPLQGNERPRRPDAPSKNENISDQMSDKRERGESGESRKHGSRRRS
jgi:hypothetical protein